MHEGHTGSCAQISAKALLCIKGTVHPQMKNSAIFYSPLCSIEQHTIYCWITVSGSHRISNWFEKTLFTYFRWNMHCGRAHAFQVSFWTKKLYPNFPTAGGDHIIRTFSFWCELFLQRDTKLKVLLRFIVKETLEMFLSLRWVERIVNAIKSVARIY